MKFSMFLLVILTISGCTSLGDARKAGVHSTLESSKSVDDVSQCILIKWQNEKDIFGSVYGAFIQPLPHGKTVYVDGNYFIADVTKHNDKTYVDLYLLKSPTDWAGIAKNCL